MKLGSHSLGTSLINAMEDRQKGALRARAKPQRYHASADFARDETKWDTILRLRLLRMGEEMKSVLK